MNRIFLKEETKKNRHFKRFDKIKSFTVLSFIKYESIEGFFLKSFESSFLQLHSSNFLGGERGFVLLTCPPTHPQHCILKSFCFFFF